MEKEVDVSKVRVATLVARFNRLFPGLYLNAAWPTRDKIIPFRLFGVLMAEAGAVFALERLWNAQGVAAGAGLAMGENPKKVARTLTEEAFPELRRR